MLFIILFVSPGDFSVMVCPGLVTAVRARTSCSSFNLTLFMLFIILFVSPGDFSVMVCPGFGNSSESTYVRTLVHYFQERGYRMAVLNHLGVLSDVKLTSPRIFNYGMTSPGYLTTV